MMSRLASPLLQSYSYGRPLVWQSWLNLKLRTAPHFLPIRASSDPPQQIGTPFGKDDNTPLNFCILEGPGTLTDFAPMQLQEIQDNIKGRRTTIFRLMEEVRRLRIRQRIKNSEQGVAGVEENEMPAFSSSIPFLPPLTSDTLSRYYATWVLLMAIIILFGGLLAPMLELRLGIGGTSYKELISAANLPIQLSQVDPIVASFSGGAVGVISSLMVVELNNVKQQESKRCKYCHGTGYLACACCSGCGDLASQQLQSNGFIGQSLTLLSSNKCSNCSGSGKVMCPSCFCTGMEMANEHNPRIDPFD